MYTKNQCIQAFAGIVDFYIINRVQDYLDFETHYRNDVNVSLRFG